MREISERERERYQRNLLVDGFGEQGQSRLLESRVTVVGAGGLGSAVLNYLVAAGVGHIRIVESDTVSPSNLQRQVLYTTAEIGALKAEAAAARLSRLNPGCRLEIVAGRLTAADASERLHGSDVVVDCTDNYAARYVIDDYCASAGVPMVYGTAEQAGGQVSVFHARGAGGYRSLYPEEPPQQGDCRSAFARGGRDRVLAGPRDGQALIRLRRDAGGALARARRADDAGEYL